jgi:hypothetical protein
MIKPDMFANDKRRIQTAKPVQVPNRLLSSLYGLVKEVSWGDTPMKKINLANICMYKYSSLHLHPYE